jgi:hypothetical protein
MLPSLALGIQFGKHIVSASICGNVGDLLNSTSLGQLTEIEVYESGDYGVDFIGGALSGDCA